MNRTPPFPTLRRRGRYHAAEHMALKAYKRLHHVPSLEEMKNSSFNTFSDVIEWSELVYNNY